MTRIIGPPKSRRRHWTFMWCLVVAIGVGIVYIPGALAVHETGAFELDGNAVSANAPPPLGPANDWDRVCHEATNNAGCGTTSNTSSPAAKAVSWSGDCPVVNGVATTGFGCGNLNATIFTGGGSKDPINTDQWAWKDGAGGLPDKDNLIHSFAARYSLTGTVKTGTCPNGTDVAPGSTFDPTVKCEVLFFGSDRYDNSGDAQQGFWFFQSAIGLGSNAVGGGSGFTGLHTNGDVLVISDFSNGGATATITVYKWDDTCLKGVTKPNPGDCGDANLRLLATSDSAKCATGLAQNDGFCGIVNPDNTTPVPWSSDYTDKSGNSTHYLQGELYEGGVNLSLLGLGGECFATVASETRSSTSTTATLKDFVLGAFAPCVPTLTTQASTNGTVAPGTAVHDTATITITGGTNPPDPTGTVTFHLCGPSSTGNPDCTSGGSAAGTGTLGVGDVTPNDGIASADSPDVNTVASPLAPGYYCFRADWPGDNHYPGALSATNTSTECFRVKDTSTTTTAQKWLPQDTATVTTAGGTAVSGSVSFSLYESADCSGTAVQTFTDSSAPFETSNSTYYTTTKTISWRATFTPTDPNAVQGSTSHCETMSVSTLNNDTGS